VFLFLRSIEEAWSPSARWIQECNIVRGHGPIIRIRPRHQIYRRRGGANFLTGQPPDNISMLYSPLQQRRLGASSSSGTLLDVRHPSPPIDSGKANATPFAQILGSNTTVSHSAAVLVILAMAASTGTTPSYSLAAFGAATMLLRVFSTCLNRGSRSCGDCVPASDGVSDYDGRCTRQLWWEGQVRTGGDGWRLVPRKVCTR
jgi:hypothetical protein